MTELQETRNSRLNSLATFLRFTNVERIFGICENGKTIVKITCADGTHLSVPFPSIEYALGWAESVMECKELLKFELTEKFLFEINNNE